MGQVYIENKTFEAENFTLKPLLKGEYEKCVFRNCDLSNAGLSEFQFNNCEFIGCNLSLANLIKTEFREVKFKKCKMLGLHFDTCNQFGLSFRFEDCALNYSLFYKTKIKQTIFKNTQLQEVDFSECDLTGSIFDECDFTRATFEHTTLVKTDFRTSYNFSIDPEINLLRKAKFSLLNVSGLLDKYDIEIENEE